MSEQVSTKDILKNVLLLNGLGDLLLGLSLLLLADQLALMLSFNYSAEMQYLAGGWGIATLALGGWRIVAGRSSDPRLVSTTSVFGVFEGGVLSLFGLVMVLSGRLSLGQVWLGLVFSSFFTVAYMVSMFWVGKVDVR